MKADGSKLQRLTDGHSDNNLADFSPDGTKIAFISDRNDPNRANCQSQGIGESSCNWDIYVMNTDGTHLKQLTNDPAADVYPEFSPDGTKIMFNSNRSGSEAVYIMYADGSNVRKLTPDSMHAGDSNWSPGGSKITFLNNFCVCPLNSDVYVMNADGTGVSQLTSNYGNNLEPEYSPDGTEIVFANFAPAGSTCCGPGDVVVMSSADGSGKKNLTNMAPAIDSETPDWGRARNDGGGGDSGNGD